jgi:hypothetical protein
MDDGNSENVDALPHYIPEVFLKVEWPRRGHKSVSGENACAYSGFQVSGR